MKMFIADCHDLTVIICGGSRCRHLFFCCCSCDPPQQAKHDLLSSKHSADSVRHRLKYDSLAGRHMELQAEYDALAQDFKHQQRAARATRYGQKVRTVTMVAILIVVTLTLCCPTQAQFYTWY